MKILCLKKVGKSVIWNKSVENRGDLNKSQNTSNNDNNVESIHRKPTYAEMARRAVKWSRDHSF